MSPPAGSVLRNSCDGCSCQNTNATIASRTIVLMTSNGSGRRCRRATARSRHSSNLGRAWRTAVIAPPCCPRELLLGRRQGEDAGEGTPLGVFVPPSRVALRTTVHRHLGTPQGDGDLDHSCRPANRAIHP